MNITILAVGKLKEKFWTQACEEYLKRLKPYARVTVREIPDVNPQQAGGTDGVLAREGEAICAAIPQDSYAVLLDIGGTELSSPEFASRIETLGINGQSSIVFVIGGSDGVGEAVKKRANEAVSFGRITLPHNLARVVLLEQLYRAFKIIRREPYHK
ncbi:MAG: 23S rRNA (pseudouridine(1915)-N(3))-methyltransferase RlmH [Eggerthellaceae bacterium]|nr:23S rRNA (pseudouridine(1915)-N(3))-methyltransferase RlmH [Eggerthellaceae bacterium]